MTEKEFDLLLHEHRLAREDARQGLTVAGSILGVTITTALTLGNVDRKGVSDWVWGLAPLIPLTLLAVLAAVSDSNNVRSRILLYIEERLQENVAPRSHVLSFRLTQPVALSLAAWMFADLAVVVLLSAMTAGFVYLVHDRAVQAMLAVLYGTIWMTLLLPFWRAYRGMPSDWYTELLRHRPRGPAVKS